MKKINTFTHAAVLMAVAFVLVPSFARAQDKCIFTHDLEVGSLGEDVRCLQKYLNSKGFIIATSGVGSPGFETNMFGEKTRMALSKWQTSKGIAAATGNLGPVSRSLYDADVAGLTTTPVSTTVTTSPVVLSNESSSNSSDKKAISALKAAKEAIENAEDDIDDADDEQDVIDDAEETLKKAQDKLLEAFYAFIDGDISQSITLANRAQKYAQDSTEDLSSGDKGDAEEAIADAKAALSDARSEINDADEDEDNVDDAQDLYDEAKDKYDDAREAYDDEDYSEAEELAKDAEDLAEEAVDAL